METNNKQERTSITLKQETIELLKTIKSCFQIARKKDITYDELIKLLVNQGLQTVDEKVFKIFSISIQDDDTNQEETIETNIAEESF